MRQERHPALYFPNASTMAREDVRIKQQLMELEIEFPGVESLRLGSMPPHTAVIGSSGAGKTLILKHLMSTILRGQQDLGGLNFRAVVYDPKRELFPFLEGLGIPTQQIIVTHPFDARSASWSISEDFVEPAQVEELAEMIVPRGGKRSRGNMNEFFETASRIIIQDLIHGLHSIFKSNWGLRDIVEASSNKNNLKSVLLKTMNGSESWDVFLSPLEREEHDRTAGSILASLMTYVRPLQTLAALWYRSNYTFSLSKWVNGSGILLLGADPQRELTLQRVNQLLMKRVSQLALTRSEERPVDLTWFFLDELREAGELSGLRQLMTEGRSKGVRVVLGFQDIDGLYSVYGKHETEEMVGLCGNRLVLHLDNPFTRKWASEFFGEAEIPDTSSSIQQSTSGHPSSSVTYRNDVKMRVNVLPIQFHNLDLGSVEQGVRGWFAVPGRRNEFHLGPQKTTKIAHIGKDYSHNAFIERVCSDQLRVPWDMSEIQKISKNCDAQSEGYDRDPHEPTEEQYNE